MGCTLRKFAQGLAAPVLALARRGEEVDGRSLLSEATPKAAMCGLLGGHLEKVAEGGKLVGIPSNKL